MLSDQAIERRMHELREISKRYAKAKAEQTYIEEFRKSKLAILMKKHQDKHASNAAQETEARRDPEYLVLLDALKVAVEEAEALRWELEIARMGVDVWRTNQANVRSEKKAWNLNG